MSADEQLQKVLNIWLSIFEATKGKLSDKQIQNFLQSKEAKELSNFPENVVIESMEYAYSINTSKLKDIYDIAVNEHFKPKIAKIIKVDADEIDMQNKKKNKEKQQDIYSSAVKELFDEIMTENKAKEYLEYFDLDGWARFWSDGDIVKNKCGGGQCGIDSNGNLKKIYKHSYLAKRYLKINQHIYGCDSNLGFHISTFKDIYGNKQSEEEFDGLYKRYGSEDFLIQDISKVKRNQNGEIVLSKEGYPIFKIHYSDIFYSLSEYFLTSIEPEVIIKNSVKKIKFGSTINDINDNLNVVKIAVLEITGDFVIKKNGETLCSYPKLDKEGCITLDEDDCVLFTEFR
tara:strand:- start:15 stop:1046 length:1032 start_codon:yes stop_codon:yes gene_type:complete